MLWAIPKRSCRKAEKRHPAEQVPDELREMEKRRNTPGGKQGAGFPI
jgi:hypothetical protein